LDPLSADEFATAAAILRREHEVQAGGPGLGWRFASIELAEPTKAELRAFERDGTTLGRHATVICLNRTTNATYKSVVSLGADRVESFEHVPGVQANFTVDEFVERDRALRAHPDVIAALAKRASPTSTWSSWTPGPTATTSHRPSSATAGSGGRTPGARTRPVPIRTRTWSAGSIASST
jgi:Cu2+-containing amine oxidase